MFGAEPLPVITQNEVIRNELALLYQSWAVHAYTVSHMNALHRNFCVHRMRTHWASGLVTKTAYFPSQLHGSTDLQKPNCRCNACTWNLLA